MGSETRLDVDASRFTRFILLRVERDTSVGALYLVARPIYLSASSPVGRKTSDEPTSRFLLLTHYHFQSGFWNSCILSFRSSGRHFGHAYVCAWSVGRSGIEQGLDLETVECMILERKSGSA
jgi:hypothetical protein